MVRRLLLLTCLGFAVTAPASASPAEYRQPPASATVAQGGLPWFEVVAPGSAQVQFLVGSAPKPDETGFLRADVAAGTATVNASDGIAGWRLPATSIAAIRPGRYWWQAVTIGIDGAREVGPLRPYAVTLPAGATRRERIPAQFGRQGRGAFLVSRVGLPSSVPAARLWSIAAQSAHRWGLRATGWTSLRAVEGDRQSVVGFGRLSSDLLGRTYIRQVRRYRRLTRCGVGGCREIRRQYVGTAVLERDVTLNDRMPWQAGPDYPWLDQADLESVVLHELGHFAGNRWHVGDCTPSPLAESAALGEWWRSPRDLFRARCTRVRAAQASARGVRPARRLRFDRHVTTTTRVTTVHVGG